MVNFLVKYNPCILLIVTIDFFLCGHENKEINVPTLVNAMGQKKGLIKGLDGTDRTRDSS